MAKIVKPEDLIPPKGEPKNITKIGNKKVKGKELKTQLKTWEKNMKDKVVQTSLNEEDSASDDYYDEDEEKDIPTSMWEVLGENTFKPTGDAVTVQKIPAGYYSLNSAPNIGVFIKKKSFINDGYIELPIDEFKEIMKDIETFWNIKDQFDGYNFIHKRGILLYGRQGTGKSFLISALINDLVNNRGGCVFSISNSDDLSIFAAFFTANFRKIEPDRPVIVTIEDIDGLMMDKSNETRLLNILDGIKHTSNIVYLATTNHIEKLEERVSNRPSRFDRRYHIKEPNDAVRRTFITKKMKEKDLKKIDVDEWVEKTEGFNLSHIKELIISVVLYHNELDYALQYINAMRAKPEVDYQWNQNQRKIGWQN